MTIVKNAVKLNAKTLKKIEEGFLDDGSLGEIAFNANISQTTLANWLESFPKLKKKLESLRYKPKWRARKNILTKLEEGDVPTSQWYLERKLKSEFAPRQELTGPEGIPLGYAYSSDIKQLDNKQDAVQINKAEEVPILPTSGDSESLGEEIRDKDTIKETQT